MKKENLFYQIIVLSTSLGVDIATLSKSFKNSVYDIYKLSWYKKIYLKNSFDEEFFIWSWAIASCYGENYYQSQGMKEEAVLYRSIFEDYLLAVSKNKYSYEIFDYWREKIYEISNMSKEQYEKVHNGIIYPGRVLNKVTSQFSLKMLKIIHRDLFNDLNENKMNIINEKWYSHLCELQKDLIEKYDFIIDRINFSFKDADESVIRAAFQVISNTKQIKNTINKLQKKYVQCV